jgi:hypothetical protein
MLAAIILMSGFKVFLKGQWQAPLYEPSIRATLISFLVQVVGLFHRSIHHAADIRLFLSFLVSAFLPVPA